ncbi:MAG TPA: hypothetical protein VE641_21355, partial [Chthoniobacterales bacterium]|nr:hypothetical protein [Chthoniobacterales bacterium]
RHEAGSRPGRQRPRQDSNGVTDAYRMYLIYANCRAALKSRIAKAKSGLGQLNRGQEAHQGTQIAS